MKFRYYGGICRNDRLRTYSNWSIYTGGSLLLIGILAIATILNLSGSFFGWDYPSQMGFGALMLFFAGAGRYSLDKALFK